MSRQNWFFISNKEGKDSIIAKIQANIKNQYLKDQSKRGNITLVVPLGQLWLM